MNTPPDGKEGEGEYDMALKMRGKAAGRGARPAFI
jgi:hypothetical protein